LPTPPTEDGSADLSYILGVADALGPLLKRYSVIIDKSTVPVGTAEQVRARITAHSRVAFDVASSPEFFREGLAVQDFMEPDRIVVGVSSTRAKKVIAKLYEPLTKCGHPIFYMEERSAELVKYASNTFLATKITFMNEIANLCEKLGANVDDVRLGVGSDTRIGPRFLDAGIGYGGSCFPKDVQALLHTAQSYDYEFNILETVIALNDKQRRRLQQKILEHFGNDVRGKVFALWGLAFKPDTDDIRQSVSLQIIEDLVAQGAKIQAYDPQAMDNVRRLLGQSEQLSFADDKFAALVGADALVVATAWPQFARAPLAQIKASLNQPVVFDGRNMYELDAMRRHGFYYESIGRAVVISEDKT